jgi:uncharacterized membrane protein YcaP (DUF421 family)
LDDFWQQFLGIGADDLTWYQMAVRSLIIYVAALAMVRVGEKRFLGKNTAFDVILGIILGSVTSRAINGSAALLATIVAGFVLVALHWLISFISFRSDRFGDIVKGTKRLIVEDGEILWDAMGKSNFSEQDLMSQVRTEGNTEDLGKVQRAYLERSGEVSLIKPSSEPKIIEVSVAHGVQTVRIQLEGG